MILDDFPVGNSPLIPSPHIDKAVPHSIDKLNDLLKDEPKSVDLLFALANLNFHSQNLEKAEKYFRKALAQESENHRLLSNLGLVLYLRNRNSEAHKLFKKALAVKPDLEHSLYFRAHLTLSEGKKTSAIELFKKMLELYPKNQKALAILGGLYQENGDIEKARKLYHRVTQNGDPIPWVEHQLSRLEFFRGKESFEKGEFFEAFQIWKIANQKFERSFVADKTIASELRELQQKFKQDNSLEELFQQYAKQKRSENGLEQGFYHEFMSALYFELGLFPEFYLRPEEIEGDREFWLLALEERGDHPYAWFKLAVGHSFQGDISKSLSIFLRCMDNLLPKKQQSLGLREIVKFLKRLERLPGPDSLNRSQSPENEWEEHGFLEYLERELWIAQGFEPLAARNWKECGLLPKQAREWSRLEHTPKSTSQWLEQDIEDPKVARVFSKGNISPKQAQDWLETFKGSETEAVQFNGAGIKNPAEANEWLQVFNMPWEAGTWNELGFKPKETQEWFRKGVSDPFEAQRLSNLAEVKEEAEEDTSKTTKK